MRGEKSFFHSSSFSPSAENWKKEAIVALAECLVSVTTEAAARRQLSVDCMLVGRLLVGYTHRNSPMLKLEIESLFFLLLLVVVVHSTGKGSTRPRRLGSDKINRTSTTLVPFVARIQKEEEGMAAGSRTDSQDFFFFFFF